MTRPRPTSKPLEIEAAYDVAASGFDERFAASKGTVARFRVFDDVQRAAALGARAVLELGVGTARLLDSIDAPLRVGIDLSMLMLREARRKGCHAVKADAHALPFAPGSFDAILAGNGVFRYLDYEPAFRESARVLRPGGRVCVHQYAAWTLTRRTMRRPPNADDRHVSDPEELRRPARAHGLAEIGAYFWRNLARPPYALRVPGRFRLWTHLTLVFEKRAGRETEG